MQDGLKCNRLPPSHLEAERAVLGAMLIDNDKIDLVAEIIRPGDFWRDAHAEAFRSILRIHESGKPLDGISFADDLVKRGQYQKLGGDEFLFELTNSVPYGVNAVFHAGLIKESSTNRKAITAAESILNRVYACESTADENLAFAEKAILAIGEADVSGHTHDANAFMDQAMEALARRTRGEFVGLVTGYRDLDTILGGLEPGQSIVLGARPSHGKTSLAMGIAARASEQGKRVLFVALEMNARELGERLLSYYSGVPGYKIRVPRLLDPASYAAIGKANDYIRKLPFIIDDKSGRTVSGIGALARRTKSRGGLDLVVVDQLNLIDGEQSRSENGEQVISKISRNLKLLAKTLGVPIIIAHQLNRSVESRDDRKPMLSDLRSSGQVEADADIVLLLSRPEFYDQSDRPGEADLYIAKNRNGATGAIPLMFQKDTMRFDTLGEQPKQF